MNYCQTIMLLGDDCADRFHTRLYISDAEISDENVIDK